MDNNEYKYKMAEMYCITLVIVITIIMLFLPLCVKADTIRIGVIDTGYSFNNTWPNSKLDKPKLCKEGHKDFTGTSLEDTNEHSHGTHIASLIAQGNNDVDYCLVIIKYYDKKAKDFSMMSEINSINYAIKAKVNVINLSIDSTKLYVKEECTVIKKALNKGIKVVVSSGNSGKDLDKFSYFPALCDKRLVVAMDGIRPDKLEKYSNYSIKSNFVVTNGNRVRGLASNNKEIVLSGTSQSAALVTNKLIKEYNK